MINNSSDDVVVYDVIPESIVASPQNNYGRKNVGTGFVEIETLYINNLTVEIVVVDRNGFRHVVNPCQSLLHGKFTIRTIYKINDKAFGRCKQLISGLMGTTSRVMKIISTRIQDNSGDAFKRDLMIIIDHAITIEQLHSAGNSIYIQAADHVISSLPFDKAPAHPYATGTVSENEYLETLGIERPGWAFALGIIMVNRKTRAPPMFTFIMKKVRKIPVNKNSDIEEGFYVTELIRASGTNDGQCLVTNFFTLDQANEIGIYSTQDEALTNGDVKLLKEQELLQLRQEHEEFKIQSSKNKQELDASIAAADRTHHVEMQRLSVEEKRKEQEHDNQLRNLKEIQLRSTMQHEAYIRTMDNAVKERERSHAEQLRIVEKERERIADLYEEKSYKRKDFSEVLKIISITIATMGGMYATYAKFFAKD